MQKSYCYNPGVRVRMQNVRANVKVMEFQSLCIFSCILTLLIILIKPLTTKAHDRRASGDCGTSDFGLHWEMNARFTRFSHDRCPFISQCKPKSVLQSLIVTNVSAPSLNTKSCIEKDLNVKWLKSVGIMKLRHHKQKAVYSMQPYFYGLGYIHET